MERIGGSTGGPQLYALRYRGTSDTRQGNGVRWDRLDEIEGAEVYF